MKDQPIHCEMRRFARGLLTAALALAALGCGNKFKGTAPEYREAGSPKFALNDPTLTSLGKMDGPYVYLKNITPATIQITNAQGKTEIVKLLGLGEEAYPDPTPVATAKEKPKAEDPAVKARRRVEIIAFKMEAFKGICGTNQIFLIRMTRQAPSLVYMIVPDVPQMPGQPMTGEGTLINALVLRRGLATLELSASGATSHPALRLHVGVATGQLRRI